MEALLNDIRYSIRLLYKNPSFAVIAIAAISLSIGANTAIFSVVSSVLLKPLPYKEPDRLVRIWGKLEKEGIPKNWISEPEFVDLNNMCDSYEDLAAYESGGANLTGTGDPVRVNAARVSAKFFSILGATPMMGRVFLDEEDQPGQNQVAVISSKLWRGRFGADPSIVGRTIGLSGDQYQVVGIMPDGFQYPNKEDVWSPLAINKAKLDDRGNHGLEVVARLKTGVSQEQAKSELNRVALNLQQQYPGNYPDTAGWDLFLISMLDESVGSIRPALFILLGAVVFVLLIACANVANLLLARSTTREKEIAVRASLGARRVRLVRQLLTESVMLAMTGGVVGVLMAYAAVRAFVAFGPRDTPRIDEISVDWRVLGFSILITLVTGVVFGLAPALHISKPDLHDSLKEGARGSTGGRNLLRSVLVLCEVVCALVLLVCAGLMIKSFSKLLDFNLGYRTDHILTMRMSLPQTKYKEDPQVARFYKQVIEGVKTLPGVEAVGAISHLPLSGSYTSGSVAIEDQAAGEGLPRFQGLPYIETDQRSVSPGYFETMGIKLLEGRLFTDGDKAGAPKVAIVDESFERRFWPTSTAIGKRLTVDFDPVNNRPIFGEIVGVVAHINHYGIDKVKEYKLKFEGREQLYIPFEQRPDQRMYLAVRTSGEPTNLTNAVRGQIISIDPEQPVYEVTTMEELAAGAVAQRRLNMVLMGAFSVIALVLAVVGIYGVLSYSVTQRTHEIGIRMALGARQRSVLALVVGQGMTLVGIGLGIGLVASVLLTRLLESLLFGVSATDPTTFVTLSVVLAVVAFLACLIPARRASRVDPMIALRYE